jgi:hypothetical protein
MRSRLFRVSRKRSLNNKDAADNKLALNAGWDNDLLKIELGDLQAFDFDLGLIGFSADEIAGLTFDRSGLTDPDEAPDAPAMPSPPSPRGPAVAPSPAGQDPGWGQPALIPAREQ